ncbi:MAG: tetratricopeptide repeat protein [Cyanobacteria bacterium P01_C01_bin.89]
MTVAALPLPTALYAQAPAIAPLTNPRRCYVQLMLKALGRGKLKTVFRYVHKLARFANDYGAAWHDLGKNLEKVGDISRAEAAYREAIAQEPDLTWAHYALGKLWHRRSQEDGGRSQLWRQLALDAYQQVTRLAPDFFWGWQDLAEELERNGSWEEAIVAFEQAEEIQPRNPWPAHHRGHCLRSIGQWDPAIAAFKKSIELKPDFPWNYVALGEILEEKGRWSEASDAYRQAIAIDAKLPNLSQKLIQSLAQQTDITLEQALQSYHQSVQGDLDEQLQGDFLALNGNLDDIGHYQRVGDHLLALNRPDEAIAYYKIALGLDPNSAVEGLNKARQQMQVSQNQNK